MGLGYDASLYILAFDHRGSFQKKFFGVAGEPTEDETGRIAHAKRVIYEGARRALDEGVDVSTAGVLVDEQFGSSIARDAKAMRPVSISTCGWKLRNISFFSIERRSIVSSRSLSTPSPVIDGA